MAARRTALLAVALLISIWEAQANGLIPRYLSPLPPFPLSDICSSEQLARVCELLARGESESAYTAIRHMWVPTEAIDLRDALWALSSSAAEGIVNTRILPRERIYQMDRQALNLFPNSPYSPTRVLRLAIICFADGRFDEARSWLSMFMSDYPKHPQAERAALLWCESMIAKRDFKEGIDALAALETRISSGFKARLLADRAYALHELGQRSKALSLWNEVSGLEKDLIEFPPWAIVGFARFLKERGETEAALKMLRMVEDEPWQIEARMLEILWSSPDERSMLEEAEKAWVELEGNPLRGMVILPIVVGLANSKDGDVRAGSKRILAEIKDSSFSPRTRFEALWTLAQVEYSDGHKLEALGFLDELLLKLDGNPFASDGLKLYARIFEELYSERSEESSLSASAFFVKCWRNLSPSFIGESVWIEIRDDLAGARLFDTLYRLSQWTPLQDRYPEFAMSAEAIALALAKDPQGGERILRKLASSKTYGGFALYILGMLAWSDSDKERAINLWKQASLYGDKHGQMATHRLLVALMELGREQEIAEFAASRDIADGDRYIVAMALERIGANRQADGIWKDVAAGTGYSSDLASVNLNISDGLQGPWATYLELSVKVEELSSSVWGNAGENVF